MIPRLPLSADPDAPYAAFLEALRANGFSGELSGSDADRLAFGSDNSIYQLLPQAVTFPRTKGDVAEILRLLAESRFDVIAIAARGGGTGTNGQSLTRGLVVDLSRYMNGILEINVEERWVRVQAGVVKDQLNAELAKHGLFFAPELSTSNRATLGGMINTDASGQGSCLYGKTRDHVLELTAILVGGLEWKSRPLSDNELLEVQRRPDLVGEIHRVIDALQREHAGAIEAGFPKLVRSLTGYDLAHIRDEQGRFDLNAVLCGAEGTLSVLVEAKLSILPIPRHSALVNLRYESFDAGLRDAQTLMRYGAASIETVDSKVLALARNDNVWDGVREFFPEDAGGPASGVAMVEFVGQVAADVETAVQELTAALTAQGSTAGRLGFTVARGEVAVQRIWAMRKRAVGLLGNMPGDKRPIAFVEDTVVPPERLADFIAEFRALLDARGLDYGMFGHVDAGILHVRPALDMKDPSQEKLIREITDAVVALTRKYEGLLWGEHGKGVRSEYSPVFFGPLYPLLQIVKRTFDPRNQLNPGKIATPGEGALLRIDEFATRGQADRTVPVDVRAGYAEAMHCNGNGACYDWDLNTAMCPSWKGLRERRHSPRGRALLMKEWLRRLAVHGAHALTESRSLRAAPAWQAFPTRVQATIRRARGETDFSHAVKEAMDGCLACKSCVGGCPIKVDVPSFRAKFLELYHGRYLRPPKDHLVSMLEGMLPILALTPWLSNAFIGSAFSRTLLQVAGLVDLPLLAGIDVGRALAGRGLNFATAAALSAQSDYDRGRSVVIVQDAFTSFYEGQLVVDTVDLLCHLGFRPWLAPFQANGKALHVHGFLARFERVARRTAVRLNDLAATGVPLVGIDPSMTLTFRLEYPDALEGKKPPEVMLLQEWLARVVPEQCVVARGRAYRLLPHCTERTITQASIKDWKTTFERLGLGLDVLEAGCCGMAGTYGHESRNRATSEIIYGLSWKSHIAEGPGPKRLLATGYSCRSQVKRFGRVTLMHPVQALLREMQSGRILDEVKAV